MFKKISEEEKSNVYQTAFLTAMSDGEHTKDEITILEEYRREMNISSIDAERIREKVISEISQKDNRVLEVN